MMDDEVGRIWNLHIQTEIDENHASTYATFDKIRCELFNLQLNYKHFGTIK